MNDKNGSYQFIADFLERFGWLHDSLVYGIEFHGNLRYDLCVTISLRAQDYHDDMTDKSVKLILGGVTEFRLAQGVNWATFETSSGIGLATDGERNFVGLGASSQDAIIPLSEFATLSRHRKVEDIRQGGFYFDCTDFIGEVLPLEDIADDHFGDQKDEINGVAKGNRR